MVHIGKYDVFSTKYPSFYRDLPPKRSLFLHLLLISREIFYFLGIEAARQSICNGLNRCICCCTVTLMSAD